MRRQSALMLFLLLLLGCASGDCPAQRQPREGYITTQDNVRLFYRIVGSGQEVLVVVHGGPGNTMDSILPDLEPLAKNRTVIYYDQRGNGRSDLIKERDRLAIEKHVEDLETVRKFFKLDKMRLMGNSWGGVLVSFYAVAHPDRVERMILHDPATPTRAFIVEASDEIGARIGSRYNKEQQKRFAFIRNPANWVKAEDPRAMCREWAAMLLPVYVSKTESIAGMKGDVCSGPPEAVRYQQVVNTLIWQTLGDWNLLPRLAVVKAPVLIIHGEVDPIPVESSEAWARGYADARLLVVKDAGHLAHVEQPEIFFKAVETFLKGAFPPEAKRVGPSQEKR